MNDIFIKEIENILKKEYRKYSDIDVQLSLSNRSDLGQFQSNDAFRIAKILRKNPIDLAKIITESLSKNEIFSKVSYTEPGFINLTVNKSHIEYYLNNLSIAKELEIPKKDNPNKIIIDYGGVNIAKAMHVGHLRSAIIGESIKRIFRIIGDEVISDIHLGDWGLPMGMLIAEIKNDHPDWCYFNNFTKDDFDKSPVSINDLELLYPRAAMKCKNNENYREIARIETKELQNGHKGYIALWNRFIEVSVSDIKKQFDLINVEFDLWNGESSVNSEIKSIIDDLYNKNIIIKSNNALVINVENESDKSPMPPLMLVTKDETVTYAMTDLATIVSRISDYKPDNIIYVVDKRQGLHFEQLFRAARISNIADDNISFEHIGFGTVNGIDNKPFKTRDGNVMRLSELFDMVRDKVSEKINQENIKDRALKNIDEKTINLITIAAIKFADLSTEAKSDYIFDVEKFTNMQGKTGPYILYSAVRIKSIIEKSKDNDIKCGDIKIDNEWELNLALKLIQWPVAIESAYKNRSPHIICEYIYNLSQLYSSFYQNCSIIKENNKSVASSRLSLSIVILRYFEQIMYILGIEIPDKM